MNKVRVYLKLCIISMLFSCLPVVAYAATDSQISLTVEAKGSNQIYLSWSKVSKVQEYEIYRATTEAGAYTEIASTKKLYYDDKNSSPNITYYYKIKAVSNNKTIASSKVKWATTSKKVYKDTDKAVFTNEFLEKWVRSKLHKKSNDKITVKELDKITIIQFGGENEISDEDNIYADLYYDEGMGLQINGEATIGYNFYSLADFSQFRKLKKLALVAEQITDISPLANLSLEELDLRGNHITDISPLYHMSSLKQLKLSENPIVDISPLTKLIHLTNLEVAYTFVASLAPLSSLTKLENLSIDYTKATNLSSLAKCKNLSNFSAMGIEDVDLSFLSGNKSIQILSFSKLNQKQVKHLQKSSVTILNIDFSSPNDLSDLNLPKIEFLTIYHSTFTDLSFIKKCTSLTEVSICNTTIDDISDIYAITKLKSIDFSQTTLTDATPLKKLTRLQSVVLPHTAKSSYQTFSKSVKWKASINNDPYNYYSIPTGLQQDYASGQTDATTKKELEAAVKLGIIPTGMSAEGDITSVEFLQLLKNTIILVNGNSSVLTEKLAKDYKKMTIISRADGAYAFYLAAKAMGIDTHYANGIGKNQIDYDRYSKNQLFTNLGDSYFVTGDYEKTSSEAIVCAGWFVTLQGSLITYRSIMTTNDLNEFKIYKNLSRKDAILGAWRLYTSIEQEDYYTPDEAKTFTYDKSIITDELLKKSSNLPDISYDFIPRYNAMSNLQKAYSNNWCGDGWFYEDSMRACAAAGINFLSVRYDFSELNYPDYDCGKINLNELNQLDQLIAWGIKYDIHICIEGNGMPDQGGYPRGLRGSDQITREKALDTVFFGDKEMQKKFLSYWEVLASRYADIPSKYLSFNLLCEIGSPDEKTYVDTFLPIAEAIRIFNKDRVVFAYGNVGKVFDGLAAYGYPLAWSIFYPDMYTQIGLTDNHPLYDHIWKNWFLNGCLGYDSEGPKKVDIKLCDDISSATFYLCNTSSYLWQAYKNTSPASFSILADGVTLKNETLADNIDWQEYTVNIPQGTSTLTLAIEEGGGYLTYDGIILTKDDGIQIKVIPTTYDYPAKSVPEATVTISSDGTVTSDIPNNFDLLLAQNALSAYLEIAKKYEVGIIVAEWGPVTNERKDEDALDYYALFAKGFRELGITAAPTRTPGNSFSTLILKNELPVDDASNPGRYIPVGDGSDYYIDTWEYKALTGKTYKR